MIKISEIFYSIQGEGLLLGVPSVFIRLAGCDLSCSWCDTSYAITTENAEILSVNQVVNRVCEWKTEYVVITGGEPLQQRDCWELAAKLDSLGKHITIETNATIPPENIVCNLASLSPKLAHSGNSQSRRIKIEALRSWIDEYDYQLKLVVKSAEDIPELQNLLRKIERKIPQEKILLMAEGEDEIKQVVELCKQYHYRYMLRLHKILYGNKRGV